MSLSFRIGHTHVMCADIWVGQCVVPTTVLITLSIRKNGSGYQANKAHSLIKNSPLN